MGRRKKYEASPEQLSLENVPGFWGEEIEPQPTKSQAQPNKSSCLAKEPATQYSTTRKVVTPTVPAFSESQLNQIRVYVGITFDPCQGIREAKQQWRRNPIPSEVVFDCTPLELSPKYATEPKLGELFAPEEAYLIGRGGLLSNAVFINLLRCYGTLAKWSQDDIDKKTGTKPITDFKFIQPDPQTPAGKRWNVLGMSELTKRNPRNAWTSSNENLEFQSRIVTPFLLVKKENRNNILENIQTWLDYISDRIGNKTQKYLFNVISEVVKNLVEHGYRGTFGISVWPSGQIEILWSNPIDHLISGWPPGDTAQGLAEDLLNSTGAGMPYIYDDILPKYKGVLIINWKTHHLIFRSNKDFSIMGLKPRGDSFLPRSILFCLHLFCPETRDRSFNNAIH